MPLVLAWLATRPSFCIVQIGANRGDTPEDPLFRFLSTELPAMTPERRARTVVVLVEPAAEDFKRLRDAYAGVPCVRFENVAVAETRGVRELNRLGVDPVAHGYPSWMSELGSLRADRMTALWDEYEKEHGAADRDIKGFYERWSVREPVTCVTFDISSSATASPRSTCCKSIPKATTTASCGRSTSTTSVPRSSITSAFSCRQTRLRAVR